MHLAPGKVLVNPEFVDVARLPKVLKSWDVLVAPEPDPGPHLATEPGENLGILAKLGMSYERTVKMTPDDPGTLLYS